MFKTESNASVYDLLDLAGSLVGDTVEAAELSCTHCDRRIDTYSAAHDEPVAALRVFLEHCAFDHAGRADVLVWQPTRRISFTD